MTNILRLPFLLESNQYPTISLSSSWQFVVKDGKIEEVDADNITTPHQQQKKQFELLIKELNITQIPTQSTSTFSSTLFLTLTNESAFCQLLELSCLSNARFIEIYHSPHPTVCEENISSLIYLTTMKGNPVPLGESARKLFTHEFTFPGPASASSSSKPMPFLHLKFLSIKPNGGSGGGVRCEILHWRLFVQVLKIPSLDALPSKSPVDAISLTPGALSPHFITEKLLDLQKMKQDLTQLQQKVQSDSKPLPAAPLSTLSPISGGSNSNQNVASLLLSMQKSIFEGMEEMLDRKLAPIFKRLDCLEDQLVSLQRTQSRPELECNKI